MCEEFLGHNPLIACVDEDSLLRNGSSITLLRLQCYIHISCINSHVAHYRSPLNIPYRFIRSVLQLSPLIIPIQMNIPQTLEFNNNICSKHTFISLQNKKKKYVLRELSYLLHSEVFQSYTVLKIINILATQAANVPVWMPATRLNRNSHRSLNIANTNTY